MPTKRVAIIADLHCGHRAGLTPPRWRFRECSDEHVWKKFTRVQADAWDHYMAAVQRFSPITCLFVNGDCIDGRGEKSGGTELLTGDRNEQCKIAVDCIRAWKFDGLSDSADIVMTRGTDYHVGDVESWEDVIAEMLKLNEDGTASGHRIKIGDHEWPTVNGLVFDLKHHVGSSGVPHTRATPVKRDELWNLLWAEAGDQPRGQFIVRSHVHYCEGAYKWIGPKRVEAMTTPALQAMGTRYGARRCSGIVNWGLLVFDIDESGRIVDRCEYIIPLASTKATPTKV